LVLCCCRLDVSVRVSFASGKGQMTKGNGHVFNEPTT
jgi:hypothetical protein